MCVFLEEESVPVVQVLNFWRRELEEKSVSSVRIVDVPDFTEGKCKTSRYTFLSHTLCYADSLVYKSYRRTAGSTVEETFMLSRSLERSVCIEDYWFCFGSCSNL